VDVLRTVDPYRDVDVIDARAPRFNQVTVALVSAVAVASGAWWLLGVLALQLIAGLTFGRCYCLPCVLYFEVVQPRLGEGPIEDSRPPRFANIVGATFLTASTLAYAGGWHVVGAALAIIVATLAALAATTGLCVGCELYKVVAKLRGIRPGSVDRVDLVELGAPSGGAVIQFTHPLCTDCRDVTQRLTDEGRDVVLVDVRERPDLARKYHVAVVPTAVAVAGDGAVLQRLA